jgi:poly(3-hydroxybutyrate) depolymerase
MSAGAGMAGLTALRHPGLFAAAALHSGAALGEARSPSDGMRTMRRGALHEPAALIESLLRDADEYPGMPALILHGQNDAVVAPRNATQLAQQFLHINWLPQPHGVLPATSFSGLALRSTVKPAAKETVLAKGTAREYQRWDFLRGRKAIVRLCLIKGVGHAWSGGDATQKFNAKEGPAASALIWQFFNMHRRDG